ENAVKTQIWIAISVYVLIAIVKKRLGVEAPLYTILVSPKKLPKPYCEGDSRRFCDAVDCKEAVPSAQKVAIC
ncbi:MAG: hypothetical protein ACREDH_02115, partial [Methylocella sp.]